MRNILKGIKRTVKNISKPLLVRMIRVALDHPQISSIARRYLQYCPWLEVRLKRLYHNKFLCHTGSIQPSATMSASQEQTAVRRLPMTTHAGRIYMELKQKIAQGDRTV
jgi:hypothetical protein